MVRRDGTATRERILDATERLVLRQGFSATTVDAVIGELGITKGALFHHFPSKQDLGFALVRRYADRDIADLHRYLERADDLASEPLQRLLLFVGLLAEDAHVFVGDQPGCLYGSYVYEQGLFGDAVQAVVADAVLAWREAIAARIREVIDSRPPRGEVDPDALADTVMTAFEGSYVLSRATGNPEILRQQLRQVRSYMELLLNPSPAGVAGGARRGSPSTRSNGIGPSTR